MSLGNWGQSLLQDAAGTIFGSDYLRDYTHASKIFRTNSYAKAPKLKFLFHTYFSINPNAYNPSLGDGLGNNFGLLVKDIRLPNFSFNTTQLNQYNRKRIVQTKIKYDPATITFHDDNNNYVNTLWQAYYTYYYKDGSNPVTIFSGNGSAKQNAQNSLASQVGGANITPNGAGGAAGGTSADYNKRTTYLPWSEIQTKDWGYIGETNTQANGEGVKPPFFQYITVYGFNQHNFMAYTFVNPIITQFGHDTYNYEEGGGTMKNTMSIDYETVVYNSGAISGGNPTAVVPGFGDPSNYDTTLSPIAKPGSNKTILGQGGLVDGLNGTVNALGQGNILGAIVNAGTTYNTFNGVNLGSLAKTEASTLLQNALTNTPNTRNTSFNFMSGGSTPGPNGQAGSPTVGVVSAPPAVTPDNTGQPAPTAGQEETGT